MAGIYGRKAIDIYRRRADNCLKHINRFLCPARLAVVLRPQNLWRGSAVLFLSGTARQNKDT